MAKAAAGMTHTMELAVTPEMTAHAMGNRGVHVLASPRLLGLFEQAAIQAIQGALAPGEGTVGSNFAFKHTAATPVGMRIKVTATVTTAEGRRVVFRLHAEDEREPIAEGEHERFVIDQAKFLERVAKKASGG